MSIKYKILLYTFKALSNLAPVYLQELVNAYQPTRASDTFLVYLYIYIYMVQCYVCNIVFAMCAVA
jgi:hypothetical protein